MLLTETPFTDHQPKAAPAVTGLTAELLSPTDSFPRRHIGPSPAEAAQMLQTLGFADMDALIDEAVPKQIRWRARCSCPPGAVSTRCWRS